jgi:hypothetical protein
MLAAGAPPADMRSVRREYRMSTAQAVYLIGFSLVWFGLIVGLAVPDVSGAAAVAGLLVVAVAPALATALLPYKATLSELGELEFRSVLRRQRLRAQQIRELRWDEDDIYLIHDSGKVHISANKGFKDLLARVLELNPAIKVDDDARALIADPD